VTPGDNYHEPLHPAVSLTLKVFVDAATTHQQID
jgi:hypothetical protein